MNTPNWQVIVDADDDEIEAQLLHWAGLEALWSTSETNRSRSNLVDDVVEHCLAVEIVRETWDAGAPGRSGVWHTISTNDPEGLRAEMRERVEQLLSGGTTERRGVAQLPSPRTPAEFADRLYEEALRVEGQRGPAGYSGLYKADVQRLRAAAARLRDDAPSGVALYQLLIDTLSKLRVPSARAAVEALTQQALNQR